VLGGTAGLGRALALRLASVGLRVLIGSRDRVKGERAAEEVNAIVGGELASGGRNEDAASEASMVFFAIPFSGLYRVALSVKGVMAPGSVAVSCIVPLESELGGGLDYIEPPSGSAAEALQAALGEDVRVVSALTYVSAHALEDLRSPVDCDIAVCGEREAAFRVMEILSLIRGVRTLYAGGLRYARITERLTVLLLGLNREYRSDRVGVRFTYIPQGGAAGYRV